MKRLQNLSYKTLFTILFFALAGIVFFLKIGGKTTKVSAAWWDEMWHYRKAISISNTSGSNLTDFQVSISVGTSQLIADGKMQTDCDDIRITDINGNLLPYWISGCNTSDTKIWPKISLLPTAGSIVYFYYGNPSAESGKTKTGTSDYPGLSCKSILDAGDSIGDNNYWIDPTNGSISDKFQAYCDMTNDNGGWMLVTQSMINSEVGSSVTPTKTTNINNGVDFSIMNDHSGCGGSTYYRVLFNDIIPWTKIKADYEFLGGHSCWSIFGNTGYSAGTNLTPFVSATDTIRNQIKMGGSNGDNYDGVNSRCDNETFNFWHSNQGVGTTRSAQVILRRNSMGSLAGIGTGVGCDVAGYPWKYKNIYIREDTMTFSVSSSPQTEETGTSPIAYWKFDEGSGATTFDSTSNQNNGSITGATWQNEDQCISGKCLYFNGTSNYVTIPNSKSVQIVGNQTISMWLKPTAFGSRRNPINKAYGGEFTITLETSGGMSYYWGTSGANNSPYQGFGSNNLTLNSWNYVTLVRDLTSNQLTWYINGKQTNQVAPSYSQATASTSNIIIGSGYAGSFIGYIDEVKLYPYARTTDQVKQDYNSRGSTNSSSTNLGIKSNTAPSLKSSLVAHWKFDENNGTTAYNSIGANNGTLSGETIPAWIKDGHINSSIGLNGNGTSDGVTTGSHISIPESITRTDSYPNGVSYSIWLNVDTDAADRMSLFFGAATIRHIEIFSSSKYFRTEAALQNGYSFGSGTFPYDVRGKWSNFVIVFANNEPGRPVRWYQNGKLFHTGNLSSGTNPTTEYFSFNAIGRSTGSVSYSYAPSFKGKIDDFRIYNTSLTEEQIKQIYNASSAAIQFGQTNQTIGGTTTSLDYCIPGDTSYCSSPVAEWKFEENTGTTAKDTSGNNNNGAFGTGSSAPTWAVGANNKGSGLKFDGNDYTTAAVNGTNLADYSINFWFKTNTISGTTGILQWANSISSGSPMFYVRRDNASIDIYNSGTYSSTTPINSNAWYYFSAVYSAGSTTTTIYINGIPKTTFARQQTYYNYATNLYLGNGYNGFFDGQIDDVKVYNYARTPAQIAYDYNKGAPVGWWKLDECQGNIAYDSSGVGNTGLIVIGSSGTQNSIGTCQIGTSAAWTNGASGKINSSLNFDGADDYITGFRNVLNTNMSSETISAWIKPSNLSGDKYIFTQNGPTLFRINNTKLIGGIYTGTWTNLTSTNNISANVWTHVIMTYDGNNIKLYINGKLDSTLAKTGNLAGISSCVEIGRFNSGSCGSGVSSYFDGQMDDVRLYNYALTSEQVKQVYNGGSVNFQ